MNLRIFIPVILIGLVSSVSGCSETWEESGISNATAKAPIATEIVLAEPQVSKKANEIMLFPSDAVGRPFTVIKNVKVAVNKTTMFNADPTVAQVEARLRETASELKGDAVVNVSISEVKVRVLSWGGRTGTGTVVKY